jgi:hypothetical protein
MASKCADDNTRREVLKQIEIRTKERSAPFLIADNNTVMQFNSFDEACIHFEPGKKEDKKHCERRIMKVDVED